LRAILVTVAATLVLSSGCGGNPHATSLTDHPAKYRADGLDVGNRFVRAQAHAEPPAQRRDCSGQAARLRKVTAHERLAYMQGCRKAFRTD
jgi:hypothetical protein